MAGKVTFTLEEYKSAAIKWRQQLLLLPILGLGDTTQYMTGRPGIRYEEMVGMADVSAEFGPYDPNRKSDANLDINFRKLKTYFGSVIKEFEPNSCIQTILGAQAASKGNGLKDALSAKTVLSLIASSLGENLNDVIWKAVRNATGTTSKDLFDGFDTITAKEITAGNISVEKKNLLKINQEVTAVNAVEIAKKIVYGMHPKLRQQKTYLYCTQHFADMYNEGYLLTHASAPYNNQFNQVVVEGSNGNCVLCPLPNKDGSDFFHVSTKQNLLYGYDTMSDTESVGVEKYSSFVLTYEATCFFGVEFETIDPRRLLVVDMKVEEKVTEASASGNETGAGDDTTTNPGT